MRIHRDVRQLRAHPKPESCLTGSVYRLPGTAASTCAQVKYEPYQSLKIVESFESGEINTSPGWYCPDCGAPADLGNGDDVPCCCKKCGSCEPFRFDEGK